jgi:hypothetical protein
MTDRAMGASFLAEAFFFEVVLLTFFPGCLGPIRETAIGMKSRKNKSKWPANNWWKSAILKN